MPSIDSFRSLAAAARLLIRGPKSSACVAGPAGLLLLFAATLAGQLQLSIQTSSLSSGTVGVPYSAQLQATGGVTPYTWTWSGPPPGLSLATSGAISGTPTTAGTYTVSVSLVDASPTTRSTSFFLTIAAQSLSIATSLPGASVGQSYNQPLVAGGTPPYTVQVTAGSLPPGLTFNGSNGTLGGTPTSAGSFSFSVQASDANHATASGTLTLAVASNTTSLQIAGPSALFNGTAGTPYTATTFTAQGGTPPYTWSILSGNADGLTMSAAGVLSGTPLTDGTFSFIVQVADNSGLNASQTFSVVINQPSLSITAGSFPAGTVGVPYNQTSPAAVVSGGTSPYTWSLAGGSIPGLTFVPANVGFTGTPTQPGTFSITLQVSDSSQPALTASRAFSVTIAPASLTITTARQLPDATLNVAYSEQLAASGGTPPYTWAANGLPKGLTINTSTGLISGVPTAAGSFPIVVITVQDSALKTYQDNFSIAVTLPAVPALSISGLSSTANPASQYPLQVGLAAPYSSGITGKLIIGFQPNSGLGDSTIQFSTGGGTASFTIAAGTTSATFLDSNGVAVPQLQIQTGTVGGFLSVSVSNLSAAGVDITPVPAPSTSAQITAQAPVISSVVVSRDGSGGCPKGQLCLQVTGFSTAREVTQAVYTFTAASGQTLQSSAGSITVDVSQVFSAWFAASTIGSQFILSQPFTVTGDPASVIPASVTLTNRLGSATSTSIGQ